MIEITNLKKNYGSIEAVKGISFQVREGEIYGLLGPNGAGKSTSISMISGLLKPDAGTALIGGQNIWLEPKQVKCMIGVVPQETAIYEELSAQDNLRFWGSLFGLSGKTLRMRVNTVLTRVGLSDRAKEAVSKYSGGMKRRLNLAMGLIHQPKFLFLDEPTVGIDPQARLAILDLIREEAASGTTVLYTTHYLEEAQELCERLAILDQGQILAEGSVAELTALVGTGEVVTLLGPFTVDQMTAQLQAHPDLQVLSLDAGRALISLKQAKTEVPPLLQELLNAGIAIESLAIKEANLQDVFIKLTGRELRD
jgi:ABC-2 type transport system ATP-binding protein